MERASNRIVHWNHQTQRLRDKAESGAEKARRIRRAQTVDKIKSTVFFYKENRISMSNI